MTTVSSLWVGGPLGKIQEICLASFLYYGHNVNLYVYDMDMKVPDGVKKIDANIIIPESRVFYHHGQLAAFSDLFRYYMIKQTKNMWVDADTLCLSDYFFEDADFVFIHQTTADKWEEFAGGILKISNNDKIVDDLIARTENKISSGLGHWCDIGPTLLTDIVNDYELGKFAVNANLVNMFTYYMDGQKFWKPEFREEIISNSKHCYSATFFNGGLTAAGIDKNVLTPGSAIEYFYNKFVINTDTRNE